MNQNWSVYRILKAFVGKRTPAWTFSRLRC